MTIYARPSATVPVWAESGDKVQPTNPEVQSGWPNSPTPPSRQRFNWVLGFIAQGVRYLLQRGIPEWAAGEDYPINARVQHLGVTYKALIASPTAAPLAVPGEWEAWGLSAGDITTPPQFDSDTSIATTAFVQRALGNRATNQVYAGTQVIPAADAGKQLLFSGGTANSTWTLPLSSAVPLGTALHIKHATGGSFILTIQRAGSENIFTGTASVTSFTMLPGDDVVMVSSTGGWLIAAGSAALQFSAAPYIGGNQTWQNLTASRALGTTYTNTTGRPITVSITCGLVASGSMNVAVGGTNVTSASNGGTGSATFSLLVIVPPGATYSASGGSLSVWFEFR